MWNVMGETFHGLQYPAQSGSTYCTSVPTSGSANTKGTWTTIISSMPWDGHIAVSPGICSAGSKRWLYDVGLGSTEVAIWENLCYDANLLAYYMCWSDWWYFPTVIKRGEEVSIRQQCSTGSGSLYFKAMVFPVTAQGISYPSCVHTYGADTSSSEGTEVDPGDTINAKGSYSELTSATTHPYQGFCLAATINGGNTGMSNADFHVDIAFGASTYEEVVVSNVRFSESATRDKFFPRKTPIYPIPIPEGTRVSVRAACDINDATDRLIDVILYCVG